MLKETDLIECVQSSLKGRIENVASLNALLSSISQERINRELAQEYAMQIRVNEKQLARVEGFKTKLYENLVSGILTKEEFLSYKRKYNNDIERLQNAIVEWNEKLTDVLENRSERNRWINHFMQFSTMEEIDRRAVMQLIRSIRVLGKNNYERPHAALELEVPAKRYKASKRSYVETPKEPEYDSGANLRKVNYKGYIAVQKHRYYLSESMVGKYIELRQPTDNLMVLAYGNFEVARIDLEAQKFDSRKIYRL